MVVIFAHITIGTYNNNNNNNNIILYRCKTILHISENFCGDFDFHNTVWSYTKLQHRSATRLGVRLPMYKTMNKLSLWVEAEDAYTANDNSLPDNRRNFHSYHDRFIIIIPSENNRIHFGKLWWWFWFSQHRILSYTKLQHRLYLYIILNDELFLWAENIGWGRLYSK